MATVLTVFRSVRHQGLVFAPGDYTVANKTDLEARKVSEKHAKVLLTYASWAKVKGDADADADADAKAKAEADAKIAKLPPLSADDETLKAGLGDLNKADMDAYWDAQDAEAMASMLVERYGRERKQWSKGQMANMIQGHLGIEEPTA